MSGAAKKSVADLELENARLRGDLLTVAKRFSHDLRTPLGGIVSSVEVVKELLAKHDPPAVGVADALLISAEEIGQLIKQLSFVVRASAIPLVKTTGSMGDPVFTALQRLESRILKQAAVVHEPESWPSVSGVPVWLEAIWWHMLLNSLKHGQPGRDIHLGWASGNDSFRFWIRDNGPGVPELLRDKLFTEFNSLHARQDVPGLGLSIVRRLVELQGGSCGHESPASGGALFFFTLPV